MASTRQKFQKSNRCKDNFFQKPVSTRDLKSDNFFVRPSESTNNDEHEKKKKPFDKKKWRLQKYSMKHKLENWEDRRKRAVMRTYHKEQKRDRSSHFDVKKIYEEEQLGKSDNDESEEVPTDQKQKSGGTFMPIHKQFLQKQEEKKQKKEEMLRIKTEKEEALKRYKQKKIEKYKKLNKKTKKGQPIMKERMEFLLEKIQKSLNQ